MEDYRDPFYTPFGTPGPQAVRRPREMLGAIRKAAVPWSGDLQFLGESYGWQALICRRELTISQRFVLRDHAIQWSEDQRRDIERGWIDAPDKA